MGQEKSADKSNEITAIPLLLDVLDLKDALVSIDAIGCQIEIASKIIDKAGDYLLAVKQNQKTLYEDIQSAFGGEQTRHEEHRVSGEQKHHRPGLEKDDQRHTGYARHLDQRPGVFQPPEQHLDEVDNGVHGCYLGIFRRGTYLTRFE